MLPTPPLSVRIDDLSALPVRALIAAHLAGMHEHSPPGTCHALPVEALRDPAVAFWSAWRSESLCGIGALRALNEEEGEVKSMRTDPSALRQGVAQAVLDAIVQAARDRGYQRLYLETGTGPAFEAAHALYLRNGFEWCGPFANYTATDFNVFMCRVLRAS